MQANSSRLLLPALSLSVVAACSSGSDAEGSISALTAPQGVSVVDADDSAVATGGTLPGAGNQFPVSSDYVQDVASIQVFDPSIRAVENANGILCQIALTRFWRFVNKPAYKAQLDATLCGEQPEPTEGDGVSTNLNVFTMQVTRSANDAPQRARIWLPIEDSGTPVQINAELEVTRAPAATDRFGAFALNYAGVPSGGSVASPAMFGVLTSSSGENGFRFLEGSGDVSVPAANPGDRASLNQIALSRNVGASGGAARVVQTARYNDGSGDTTSTVEWRVVFDETNVLRQRNSDTPVALSRSDYRNHVNGYNMYHNDGPELGEQVELNAGMGVVLSSGAYGWVGYYGAWAPPGEAFANGDVVTASNGGASFTVVAAPGRLMRHSRDTILLTELGTQRFEWWDSGSRWQIAYSGVEWQRMAEYDFMGETWNELGLPTMIDVAGAGGFLGMYSPFLGGVHYIDGASSIVFFSSELVTGSDPIFTGLTELEMFATIDGLKSEIDQTDADNGDVFLATSMNVASAHRFVIDPSDMTLMLDVNGDGSLLEPVGLATGVAPTMGPNQWGMRSGPMVLAPVLAGMSNVFDVFEEPEYYVYETGHNPWNQFIGLQDSMNAFVSFDAPIEFLYTHTQANDMNDDAAFDGQQILLSYNGPGKLFGIPGEGLDLGGGEFRYLPNFSLKDGTVLGATSEFIVRAINVEQTLEVDPGGAPQLDINDANALELPAVNLYETPIIGPDPEVEGPPAVIDGVIQ